MTLLELEHVSKRYRRGETLALDDVSLVITAGEMVTVWGERQSGRSTLLRIAAGIETPDTGVVRFDGGDLSRRGGEKLGGGISYCRTTFHSSGGVAVLDQLISSQLARRVPRDVATTRAYHALQRVDAERCAWLQTPALKTEEAVRVAIARGLTADPRLLVIDEPTIGIELVQRDEILKLLRSLAEDGVAILSSTGEGTGVLGADRVLSLDKGKLHGDAIPDLAQVTDISSRRQATGG